MAIGRAPSSEGPEMRMTAFAYDPISFTAFATRRGANNGLHHRRLLEAVALPPLLEDVVLLKALLYIVSVIIALWTVVLIVAADTGSEPGRTRRRVRHRR
jgi:hypothetical protein